MGLYYYKVLEDNKVDIDYRSKKKVDIEYYINMVYMQLVKAPSSAVAAPAAATKVAQSETAGSEDGGIDQDLQARLDNLRKM